MLVALCNNSCLFNDNLSNALLCLFYIVLKNTQGCSHGNHRTSWLRWMTCWTLPIAISPWTLLAQCLLAQNTTSPWFWPRILLAHGLGPEYYWSMVLAQNTTGPWSWPRILLAHGLGPEYYWPMVLPQNTTGPRFCPRILLAHGFAPEYYWPTVLPQNTTGPRFWLRILLAQS